MAGGRRCALAGTILCVPAFVAWWFWPLYAHANAANGADLVVAGLWYAAIVAPVFAGALGFIRWPVAAWVVAAAWVGALILVFVASTGGDLGQWAWAYLVLPATCLALFTAAAQRARRRVRATPQGASSQP